MGSSEQEAAVERKPGRALVAERHGAHGVLELDQQEGPWSLNSIGTGQKAAQVAMVATGSRGYSTSIVKERDS